MSDKKIINCTTGEITYEPFTQEEIAQRAYEASLPPIIPPKTEIQLMQDTQSQVVLALVTGGLM